MRLKKQCCYYCICGYIKKKKPLTVYCTAISDYVDPNGLCNKFKNAQQFMASNKRTIEEKIEVFKTQCRLLEHNAEMLVNENYDIEPVIKMSNYGNN